MNQPSGRSYIYMPIVFALLLIVGMYIGQSLDFNTNYADSDGAEITAEDAYKKIGQVLKYVNTEYVDSINNDELTEKTVNDLLQNLDPHSTYISAKELKEVNEGLEGNFQGVGIEYNIFDDTIRVVTVIAGGPAADVGIMAGDKIIKVDGENVAGVKIKSKDVTKRLRGDGGTKVRVLIMRNNQKQLTEYAITRGEIPLYSVDISYMLDAKTGYIKLSRFAETSYEEFMQATAKLKRVGMQQLIFDLRGNGGGLLDIAVQIADEFLENEKLIVYTKGKSTATKNYNATKKGQYENLPLVILIDENSASASEILAGCLQDNDRATIVGRRSFGKGLVQHQLDLPDGSAIRLTIARYYTPTGRCIQKPYDKGTEEYYKDEEDRYESGELLNKDSIHFADSLKFKTPKGKVVYGGGGIMPDVFVPLDTMGRSKYLNEIYYNGIITDFCFEYADKHRAELMAAT